MVVLFLLVISIFLEEFILGLISSFALMVIGVSILSEGVLGIDNIITLALGTIFVCLGAYIFLSGSLEHMEQLF